jgi:hypothetical protein
MITVKIECACGQHYAFDVEPVSGRMTSTVACPICGADGTANANEIIARSLPPPLIKPNGHLGVVAEPSTPATSNVSLKARQRGQVDREQAEVEARAKISWGDSQEEVIKYLMIQGFTAPEALPLVQELLSERIATVRRNGIRHIFTGVSLMIAPLVTVIIIIVCYRVISLYLMAIALMVGLYGGWRLLKGILMFVAPKMESGDVANQ